jgi:hypothetical protein
MLIECVLLLGFDILKLAIPSLEAPFWINSCKIWN